MLATTCCSCRNSSPVATGLRVLKLMSRFRYAVSRTSRYFVSWAAAFSSGVFEVGVLVGVGGGDWLGVSWTVGSGSSPPQPVRVRARARATPPSVEWCFLMWCLLVRSEEHTSELQSLMRISYAVFCL